MKLKHNNNKKQTNKKQNKTWLTQISKLTSKLKLEFSTHFFFTIHFSSFVRLYVKRLLIVPVCLTIFSFCFCFSSANTNLFFYINKNKNTLWFASDCSTYLKHGSTICFLCCGELNYTVNKIKRNRVVFIFYSSNQDSSSWDCNRCDKIGIVL